jgi:hypothetical protein
MSTFRDAFMEARREIEGGGDPEALVPRLLELAEAPEEIDMACELYGDDDEEDVQ